MQRTYVARKYLFHSWFQCNQPHSDTCTCQVTAWNRWPRSDTDCSNIHEYLKQKRCTRIRHVYLIMHNINHSTNQTINLFQNTQHWKTNNTNQVNNKSNGTNYIQWRNKFWKGVDLKLNTYKCLPMWIPLIKIISSNAQVLVINMQLHYK